MKKNLLLGLLICLACLQASAQVRDTVAVKQAVDSLTQLSRSLSNQKNYDKALEVNTTIEKIILETFGEETKEYGTVCFNNGRILQSKGDFAGAEHWYLEAKSIREKTLPEDDPDFILTLKMLGILYKDWGKFEKAIPLFIQLKDIKKKSVGVDHIEYAKSICNLALLYQNAGDYEKAEKLYLEAKPIFVKNLDTKHPDYGEYLNLLAVLYYNMGDYEKAEPLYIQSKSIREISSGKGSANYNKSLGNLGLLYVAMGNYEKAEPLLLEGKVLWENRADILDPDFILFLVNLSVLYQKMGDYKKTESLLLEGKYLQEKSLGTDLPVYAKILNNLGALYNYDHKYDKSVPFLLESKRYREKRLGNQHPEYANTIENLANAYLNVREFTKAEQLYTESLAIRKKTLGVEHPLYLYSLDNLAMIYMEFGKYIEADSLMLEARPIWENTFGKEHPDYITFLEHLRAIYLNLGNFEKAEQLFEEVSIRSKASIIRNLNHLSERELNIYLGNFSAEQDQILSFNHVSKKRNFNTTQFCYDNSLFYKGFLLLTSNQIKRIALSDTISAEKFNQLKSCERRLAALYVQPIAERKGVVELEEKVNAIEKDLAQTIVGYREAVRQVSWQEVQGSLPSNATAIEFIHYRYSNPKLTDSTLYAALVLKPGDSQPQFIPLFEEKELTPLLKSVSSGNNIVNINALYAQKITPSKQKSLYELIYQPLENALKDSKTVYYSPSGLLHRINLAAIPNNTGQTFGDRFQLVEMGSTRQLVVPNTSATNATNNAYLAGGIRYESDSTAVAYANRGASSRSIEPSTLLPFQPDSLSISRGGVLDYLPATAAEVRDIAHTLAGAGIRAQVDTGFYATEESFRQLGVGASSPRIIHLATHGYFFPDPVKVEGRGLTVEGQEPVFKLSEHPMIRSGLIMAGAKQAWLSGKHPEGQEDGILTAYEISQMNLAGTELVVLSACETGLGDIVGNEGVFGLQRAFKIAGAKYLIMSLWKVDDKSTQDFMTTFYKHWLTDKQTVPEAFRTTQGEMRVKRAGAYDWAGFVLIE